MRSQSIVVKIENPCTQSWHQMTPKTGGNFCEQCATIVRDFTQLSDLELAAKLTKTSAVACGRIRKDQLNKVISTRSKSYSFYPEKYIAGTLLFFSSPNFHAEVSTSVMKNIEYSESNSTRKVNVESLTPIDSLQRTITGVVLDSSIAEGIPFAKVEIKELNIAVLTDYEGRFTFNIPEDCDLIYLNILVSMPDYDSVVYQYNRTQNSESIEINLQNNSDFTEVGMYIVYKPKRWWQFWKRR